MHPHLHVDLLLSPNISLDYGIIEFEKEKMGKRETES